MKNCHSKLRGLAATSLLATFVIYSALYSTSSEASEELKQASSSTKALISQYTPPDSPPLYESSGPAGTPLEFKSGLFLGTGVSFGQSFRAGGDGNKIAAYVAGVKLGYVLGSGSWARYQGAVELLAGEIGDSKGEMSISGGLIAKVGRSYSIGSKVFAGWQFGVGMAKGELATSDTPSALFSGSELGTILQLSYDIALPVGESFSIEGGLELTQYRFNISNLKSSDGATDLDTDMNLVYNMPAAHIGIRFGI